MPSVLVLGGANGAGKSTIAPALISTILGDAEFVNADTIARGLAGSRYAEVEFEAGRIFLRRIRKLAEERKDFAFESTLSSRSFAPFLRELRDAEYTIHLAFVWIDSAEVSALRVARRSEQGGHSVDKAAIHRRYRRTIRNLIDLYLPLADRWTVYDNREDKNFERIAEGSRTAGTHVLDAISWAQVLREARHDS